MISFIFVPRNFSSILIFFLFLPIINPIIFSGTLILLSINTKSSLSPIFFCQKLLFKKLASFEKENVTSLDGMSTASLCSNNFKASFSFSSISRIEIGSSGKDDLVSIILSSLINYLFFTCSLRPVKRGRRFKMIFCFLVFLDM